LAERSHLPGTSYDRLVDVIKSYGHFDTPATPGQVAQILGIDQTEVSRNNGFLVSVAVLEQGRTKQLTETGRRLARALEHEVQEDIFRYWQEVLMPDEFFQRLVAALRIRRGMDFRTFQTHVAYSAGLSRSARAMTTARAVIELLQAAGLIQELDGQLVAVQVEEKAGSTTPDEPPRTQPNMPPPDREPLKATLEGVDLQIQVQIQCTADELERLPAQLERFLAKLRRSV
jgi:hypothetical protein